MERVIFFLAVRIPGIDADLFKALLPKVRERVDR
jgi:hypothetical protein